MAGLLNQTHFFRRRDQVRQQLLHLRTPGFRPKYRSFVETRCAEVSLIDTVVHGFQQAILKISGVRIGHARMGNEATNGRELYRHAHFLRRFGVGDWCHAICGQNDHRADVARFNLSRRFGKV